MSVSAARAAWRRSRGGGYGYRLHQHSQSHRHSAVASALCGWALLEPDPVPEGVPTSLILMSTPFLLLLTRAAVRAGWALIADPGDPGTATVGLLRPWIVFSPRLAKKLDDRQIEAALEHERAHVRHWDPLRIWLAQLV